MYYLNKEQENAIKVINKLKCIRIDQLMKMNIFKASYVKLEQKIEAFNKLSYNKTQSYFNIINDTYVAISEESIDYDMLKAIDVMLVFDDVSWYTKSEYPFKLSFSRLATENDEPQNKIFDVVILKPSEELILSRTLDSESLNIERIIAVLDKKLINKYKPILTKKPIRYCTTDPVKFYKSLEEAVEYINSAAE